MTKIAVAHLNFLEVAGIPEAFIYGFDVKLEVDDSNQLRMAEEIHDHVMWFANEYLLIGGTSIVSYSYQLLPVDYHELEPSFEGCEGTIYDHTYDYEIGIY